jgi:hypothetical protein
MNLNDDKPRDRLDFGVAVIFSMQAHVHQRRLRIPEHG